jgi:hypothetical protein
MKSVIITIEWKMVAIGKVEILHFYCYKELLSYEAKLALYPDSF